LLNLQKKRKSVKVKTANGITKFDQVEPIIASIFNYGKIKNFEFEDLIIRRNVALLRSLLGSDNLMGFRGLINMNLGLDIKNKKVNVANEIMVMNFIKNNFI